MSDPSVQCAFHPVPPSPTLEEAEVGRAWTTKKMGQFRLQLPDLKMQGLEHRERRAPFSILFQGSLPSALVTPDRLRAAGDRTG